MIEWTATRYAPSHEPGKRPPLVVEDRGAGWAIVDGGACLNRDGEWEVDRMPSNRDEEYLARNRYEREEAFRAAEAWLDTNERWYGCWRPKSSQPSTTQEA